MVCPKCGNQGVEYKNGISKKTGKKWQAYKCTPCDVMIGMDGVIWGDKPKSNGNPAQAQNRADQLLEAILKELKIMNGKKEVLVDTEEGNPF